jgi:hypothetical protein
MSTLRYARSVPSRSRPRNSSVSAPVRPGHKYGSLATYASRRWAATVSCQVSTPKSSARPAVGRWRPSRSESSWSCLPRSPRLPPRAAPVDRARRGRECRRELRQADGSIAGRSPRQRNPSRCSPPGAGSTIRREKQAGEQPTVALHDGRAFRSRPASSDPARESRSALEAALAVGYRHVDTAAAYRNADVGADPGERVHRNSIWSPRSSRTAIRGRPRRVERSRRRWSDSAWTRLTSTSCTGRTSCDSRLARSTQGEASALARIYKEPAPPREASKRRDQLQGGRVGET